MVDLTASYHTNEAENVFFPYLSLDTRKEDLLDLFSFCGKRRQQAMIENFFTLSETHLRGLFLARTTPTLLPLLSLAFFAQPRLMRRNRVRMNFLTHMFPKTHFDCKKIVLDIILCHSFAYYFTHVDPFLCLAI